MTPVFLRCMIAQVMKMDELLERTLLFDFYGELLTKHQKEIYEQYISEDLSLGEIAKEAGISRQGVHDLIRRCSATLKGYEEKLHLVGRFVSVREKARRLEELLEDKDGSDAEACLEKARKLSREIIEEL